MTENNSIPTPSIDNPTESQSAIKQLVILCGGKGVRLQPTTKYIPKALVSLHDKPILDYILDYYHQEQFTDYIFCVGYKGHMIANYYRQHANHDHFHFSDAGEDAGMLNRIVAAKETFDETFLLVYGDTLVPLDMVKIERFHFEKGVDCTIVYSKVPTPFGLVKSDENGFVTDFSEKPLMDCYIGCLVMNKRVLEAIDPEFLASVDGKGLVKFFQSLIKQKRLAAYEHKGQQLTFNTEQERQYAEQHIAKITQTI